MFKGGQIDFVHRQGCLKTTQEWSGRRSLVSPGRREGDVIVSVFKVQSAKVSGL